MDQIKIRTNAKLNLCLWVYHLSLENQKLHPIRGIFQTISLHDTLNIRLCDEKQCKIICNLSEIPLNQDNDITKAYNKLKDRLKIGIEVCVKKRIPVGAGLGGGCSNAAAILQFLNRFCEPEYSISELQKLASEIGSDVPYFLEGGTCSVTIRSSVTVTRLHEMKPKWFLLIYPNFKASTAHVYKEFDYHGKQVRDLNDVYPNLEDNFGENDLVPPVFYLYPDLQKMHEELSDIVNREVCMTGSGSTLYIPVNGKTEAEQLKKIVEDHIDGVWTHVAQSVSVSND
ncbi:4-diphosphocytidyl-2-C-methyl-D-erythritol kinase-like [Ruditapes philippinarum]|uniref:4-diphosphocytidyl-2-C-methyl-D-erythritol kinase-like n=1 Tax=Ruditapes philippinarum TaxID=129788 RepID=UPI00295C1621|nr:4-diphosphocytidyl-2-C-methyl-D-erythritol kinase-like [Ruditapes philippinarum]